MTAPGSEELAAMTAMKRFDRERELDRNIINGKLAELHTHLLGMGSADFWVSRIMKVYLPRVLQDIQKLSKQPLKNKYDGTTSEEEEIIFQTLAKDLSKRPFLPTNFQKNSESKQVQDLQTCWINELRTLWNDIKREYPSTPHAALFTYDVVYSIDKLSDGFDIRFDNIQDTSDQVSSKRAHLESLLSPGVATHRWHFSKKCKEWIVFDQRRWKFKKIEGIQNKDLIELMNLSPEVLASVRNGFQMLSTTGEIPTEEDKRSQFRGNFTPAFYPQRYALKDCIYEQRLEVLAILLNQVLSRYAKAGVKYVEFSLSAKDMASERVLQTLVFDSFRIEEFRDGGNDKILKAKDQYVKILSDSLRSLLKSLNREATVDEKENTIKSFESCINTLEKSLLKGIFKNTKLRNTPGYLSQCEELLHNLKVLIGNLKGLSEKCYVSYAVALSVESLQEQIEGSSNIEIKEFIVSLLASEKEPNPLPGNEVAPSTNAAPGNIAAEKKNVYLELEQLLSKATFKDIFLKEKLDNICKKMNYSAKLGDTYQDLQVILAQMRGVADIADSLQDENTGGGATLTFLESLRKEAECLIAEFEKGASFSKGVESANKKLYHLHNTFLDMKNHKLIPQSKLDEMMGAILREEAEARGKRTLYIERILAKEKLTRQLKPSNRRSTTYANFYIRVIRDHIKDYTSKLTLESGNVSSINKQTLCAFMENCLNKSKWEPSWIESYGFYNEYPKGMQFRFLAAFSRSKPFNEIVEAYWHTFQPNEVKTESMAGMSTGLKFISGFDALKDIIKMHEDFGRTSYLYEDLCNNKFLHRLYANGTCSIDPLESDTGTDKLYGAVIKSLEGTGHANGHAETLKALMKRLNTDRLLCHFLVGLDWVSDEMFMPTNWFCTEPVKFFVKWCHQTFNKRFGLRIHGGEGVQRYRANENVGSAHKIYLLCMHTLITGINKILDEHKRLRIGHGVAFCITREGLGLPEKKKASGTSSEKKITGSEEDFEYLYERLQEFLKRCGKDNVPFEINPTSNDMLLLDTHGTPEIKGEKAVGAFTVLLSQSKKRKRNAKAFSWNQSLPRPIICTDNDGIWAIHKCQKHYHHVSIAGEICDLIQRCRKEFHPLLLEGAIDKLVNTHSFYFTDL